jgi:hypothetical protein
MSGILTLLAVIVVAAAFGAFVPIDRVLAATQPLVVAVSIMAAAILVRLNRGMPSLDWQSLALDERRRLTKRLVEVTREYVVILALEAVALAVLVSLIISKIDSTSTVFAIMIAPIVSAATGGVVVLCFARMAHVVWRDYDIVKLQKVLLDEAGERAATEAAAATAATKLQAMRAAGLRGSAAAEPKALP